MMLLRNGMFDIPIYITKATNQKLVKEYFADTIIPNLPDSPNAEQLNLYSDYFPGADKLDDEFLDRAFDVYALRSRDGTYRIYADGEDMTPRIMSDRNIPQVEGKGYVLTNEAETKVQLQSFLEEEGLLKELDYYNEPKWQYIVDGNMPGGSNYREFVFNNDNAKIPSVFRSDHFHKKKII